MEIQISTLENAPKVPFNLDGKILFSSQRSELVHLTLKSGEKIDRHVQPFGVLFFILEGEGVLETESGNTAGTKNTSIFVPAGRQRGWRNTGKTDFKILVYKDIA